MKIAFDLRWVRGNQIDGISRYALNLIASLLQSPSPHQYFLIGQADVLQNHLSPSRLHTAEIVTVSSPLLSMKDFLLTPREVERLGVDILHVPNYLTSPLRGKYKKILTVYDLIPFLFPEALSKSRFLWRWFYKTPYPAARILQSADAIIATSEHTKQDIMRLLKISAEKIHVIWCGMESRFQPGCNLSEGFFHKYQLPERFLLYVGRQDPYKGLTYLVQAYAQLPLPLRQTYPLVIAGKTDPRYIGDVHRLIDRFQLQSSVIFPGYIPDDELPQLYSAATLLVHPSLYEGFGLPPLEAMACGTPVIYADTSSLSELLGNAGFAVQPASSEALAAGMLALLSDNLLRQSYIQQGVEHAKRYSWHHAAQAILRIYDAI